MCLRYCIEAVDRNLCVIMNSQHVPFGGSCVPFRGNFRQIFLVVQRGTRGMIVFMCFKFFPLYQLVNALTLTENMRLQAINNVHETDRAVLQWTDDFVENWRRESGKNHRLTNRTSSRCHYCFLFDSFSAICFPKSV